MVNDLNLGGTQPVALSGLVWSFLGWCGGKRGPCLVFLTRRHWPKHAGSGLEAGEQDFLGLICLRASLSQQCVLTWDQPFGPAAAALAPAPALPARRAPHHHREERWQVQSTPPTPGTVPGPGGGSLLGAE